MVVRCFGIHFPFRVIQICLGLYLVFILKFYTEALRWHILCHVRLAFILRGISACKFI